MVMIGNKTWLSKLNQENEILNDFVLFKLYLDELFPKYNLVHKYLFGILLCHCIVTIRIEFF